MVKSLAQLEINKMYHDLAKLKHRENSFVLSLTRFLNLV